MFLGDRDLLPARMKCFEVIPAEILSLFLRKEIKVCFSFVDIVLPMSKVKIDNID